MEELPGNSNRQKQEQPQPRPQAVPGAKKASPKPPVKEDKVVEKVVTGVVIEKKRTFGSKVKDVFVGGDLKSAAGYIAADVLLPAFRNMVYDAITEGGRRMIFGDGAPSQQRRPAGRGSSGPRVAYNAISNRQYSPTRRGYAGGDSHQIPVRQQDIIFSTGEDAESVLENLADLIARYEAASLTDLKNLVGLPATYVDNGWGWFTIGYFEIRQTHEGWVLVIPDPMPIT